MDNPETDSTPRRILFVCTGNTCRSPTAEAIARRELEARGWDEVEVRSAGTAAYPGSPASGGAVRAAEVHGLDLSGHRSTPVDAEVVAWADLILAMSPSHLFRISDAGGGERATLLTSFAAGDDPEGVPESVPDPFGGANEEYEAMFRLMEMLVERALNRLEPTVLS